MMGTDKLVCSVCIANYNGGEVLGPCIESVLCQEGDLPLEIIVHDDASTDGSVDLIQKLYPDVHVITSTTNAGFCISNNRMAQAARGEYLLLLNNDAVLRKDAIKTLYQHARNQKAQGILSLPQYNIRTGALIDMGELLDPFMNPVPNLDPDRRQVGMVIGACLWIPKVLWDELGGFPEWFGNIAEDMYLCCVARLKGFPVEALSSSGYDHWAGMSFGGGKLVENAMRTTYRRRALSERNKSFVMFLYYPAPLLQLLFPVHILLLLLEGLALALIKRERRVLREIYLSCLASLWRERIRLSELRRSIRKDICVSLPSLLSAHTYIPYKLSMLCRHGVPTIE